MATANICNSFCLAQNKGKKYATAIKLRYFLQSAKILQNKPKKKLMAPIWLSGRFRRAFEKQRSLTPLTPLTM